MPIVACRTAITCEGVDTPVTNFSSEAPDLFNFRSFAWVLWNPNQPLPPDITGRDTGDLPIYWAEGCETICISLDSQADANRCASRQAYLCGRGNQNNDEGSGPALYSNRAQSCSAACADGSIVTLLVPSGYFVSTSQTLSDALASTYACQAANASLICLSNFTNGCQGQAYNSTSQVTRGSGPVSFALIGGALPPGLSLNQSGPRSATLTGTPTAAGNYQFSIRARGTSGVTVTKTYDISILGITDTSPLPDASVGTAYSQQLTAAGGTGPYTFFLELGSLPTGLSISESGLISGTPTTQGSSTFVISVSDARTSFCTKSFTLTVQNAMTCPTFITEFNPPGIDCFGASDPTIARLVTGSPANLVDANTLINVGAIAGVNPGYEVTWITTNKEFATAQNGLWTINPNTAATAVFGDIIKADQATAYDPDLDCVWCIGWDQLGTNHIYLNKFVAASHTFTAQVDLGLRIRRPNMCAYCPVPKVLLAHAVTGNATLDILSLPSGVVLHSINLQPTGWGDFLNGMVYNPKTLTFFATVNGDTPATRVQLVEVDPTLGIIIRTYDLGESNPGTINCRLAMNPGTGELYVMGKTLLTAVDPIAHSIICQIAMPAGSNGAGFDQASSSLFIGNFNTFHVRQYH